MSVLLTSSSD